MFKLVGAVMVIAAGGMIGMKKASVLNIRAENLQRLISALTLLENEIAYGKNDMRYALSTIGTVQEFKLFSDAAKYMENMGTTEAFMHAAEDKSLCFKENDMEILHALTENLGMSGSLEQLKTLSHTKTLLKNEYESARSEYEKNGRLYRSTGLLSGIFVAILLF